MADLLIRPEVDDRPSLDLMTDLVRERICLERPDREMVLFETELSREFQVSRTPVRQVLQRLAYEQLVRTVSGVGTVVVPLLPANRQQHETTYCTLLKLASEQTAGATRTPVDAPNDIKHVLDYVRFRASIIRQLPLQITDPIVETALIAAAWRDVRWHVGDLRSGASTLAELVTRLCSPQVSVFQQLYFAATAHPHNVR